MRRIIALIMLATLIFGTACLAQVEVDARKIAETYKDAVVTVDIVINAKMTYNGKTESDEEKLTTTATIVDPSGLVVTSLTQVSPDSFMDSLEKDSGYSYSIETKDVRIRTADGNEIPADIVLRDRDLDLAFIRPKTKPDKPLPYVSLDLPSTPQVLDQIVVLSRLGQVGNRAPTVRLGRIESVVTKPRTFYVINSNTSDNLGIPAFTLDAKCVGVLLLRYTTTSRLNSRSDVYLTVVPCSTIANAAQQAKDAKPVTKPDTNSDEKPAPAK